MKYVNFGNIYLMGRVSSACGLKQMLSEEESLMFDFTSGSLWSELIKYVEYGYNCNHEDIFRSA